MIDKEALIKELEFKFSRSGGPGGQNVNKVNTRVELLFDISASRCLTDMQKDRISHYLSKRLTSEGVLQLVANETRSQLQNKTRAIDRFMELIEQALRPVKPRKRSKPTKASKLKRLEQKSQHSEKKRRRREF